MTRDQLISAIRAHAEKTGLAPATITGRAVGNSRLYSRIESGGDCTTEVAARVAAFIEASPASENKGAA